MREILSAEQPCILCGQLLEIVTIDRDDDADVEHVRRERVEHSEQECLSFARLYAETWPCHAGTVSPAPQKAAKTAEKGACEVCSRLWFAHYPGCEMGPERALTRSGDQPLLF